jgi:CRISPR-associated protein Cmx8
MAAKRNGRAQQNATESATEPLALEWALADLPSSQHRAGLAGLVLCVRYLERLKSWTGICRIDVRRHGATLQINQAGMRALLDVVYAASREEQESSQKWKKGKGEAAVTVEPLREEERIEVDPKTKRERRKRVFIYERPVPEGGPLLELDPTREGRNGLWIKLWRDFIWSIMRGIPAQREPFESRANREDPSTPTDPASVLAAISGSVDGTVKLPSTYFLGAQEKTAEDVPYMDRARFQFLLHFWPFAASIYVPATEGRDGKRSFVGYMACVPDVADLTEFCACLPEMLRTRAMEKAGYVPRGAVVAVPGESALKMLELLRRRLTSVTATPALADVVVGVDVLHAQKVDKSIKVLGIVRIEPELSMVDEYARLQPLLWDLTYRRVRLDNLIARRPWYAGFDAAFVELPIERLLRTSPFAHDAREDFAKRFSPTHEDTMSSETQQPATIERVVLDVVTAYLSKKLRSKHGLEWAAVKDAPAKRVEYEERKEKLAKGVFYAVRSRTGKDFVEYFASTLCSVPQFLDAPRFAMLTSALRERPDDVRTLTMLALSARS